MNSLGSMIGSTLNGVGTFRGINVYDSNVPGSAVSPGVINPYSVLTVPSYWRAINFLSRNLTSFTRSVRQAGNRQGAPHPADRFLSGKPNNYQNSWQLWSTAFFHLKHYGCAFVRIERVSEVSAAIAGLHNLFPDYVVPFRFDGQQYFFTGIPGPAQVLPAADVLYLSSLSYDGLSSYNPVWLMRETFQRAMLIDRYQTRFLTKGSVIRGSIEIPAGLTDEQIEKIVAVVRTYFAGADADRDLLMLSGGAKIANGTMSNKDSELPWLGTWTVKQVAQITGVDPYFLMDSADSKYNGNAELAWDNVCRDVFDCDCQIIATELADKLLSDSDRANGFAVHLDMAAKLRGTVQTQTTVVIARANAGIISRNEARKELGLPRDPDPESDKLKVLGDTTVNMPKAPPKQVTSARMKEAEQFASAHRFASVMLNMPTPISAAVMEFGKSIRDDELAADGREDDPHCTVKYGLHYNAPDRVAAAVAGFGPVAGTLGPVGCFEASESAPYDVVYAQVNSPDIERLHGVVSGSGPHTDTHDQYSPHVTIAYCKPGAGKLYAGRMDLHGMSFSADTIHYSDRDGNVTPIPLTLPVNQARQQPPAIFDAIKPLLLDAARRVDAKSAKAFANRAGKPAGDVAQWAERFAQEQQGYAAEQLQPIADAMLKCAGVRVDVAMLSAAYAEAIRKRDDRTLSQIVDEVKP